MPVLRCDWCGKAYVPDRQPRPGQGTFCTPQQRLNAWRRRQAKVARPAGDLPHVEELQAAPPIEYLQEFAPVEDDAQELENLRGASDSDTAEDVTQDASDSGRAALELRDWLRRRGAL